MSEIADRISNRIMGARIVAIEELDDGNIRLDFEHRGTDQDAGHLVVIPGQIEFTGDDDPAPSVPLNRAQRRAARFGDGILSQFDDGPRQGG